VGIADGALHCTKRAAQEKGCASLAIGQKRHPSKQRPRKRLPVRPPFSFLGRNGIYPTARGCGAAAALRVCSAGFTGLECGSGAAVLLSLPVAPPAACPGHASTPRTPSSTPAAWSCGKRTPRRAADPRTPPPGTGEWVGGGDHSPALGPGSEGGAAPRRPQSWTALPDLRTQVAGPSLGKGGGRNVSLPMLPYGLAHSHIPPPVGLPTPKGPRPQ